MAENEELKRRFHEVFEAFIAACFCERHIECLSYRERFNLLKESKEYFEIDMFLLMSRGVEEPLSYALRQFLNQSLGNPGFIVAWANMLDGVGILGGFLLPEGCTFFEEDDEEEIRQYEWAVLARYIEVFVAASGRPLGELVPSVHESLRDLVLERWKFARRWIGEYERTYGRRFLETRQERAVVVPTLGQIFGRKNRRSVLSRQELEISLVRRTPAPSP